MMDDEWWVVGGGRRVIRVVVAGGAKFSPFVDRPLLWQQAVCQSKKDFGKLAVLRCALHQEFLNFWKILSHFIRFSEF
jgi:hypothetical protein